VACPTLEHSRKIVLYNYDAADIVPVALVQAVVALAAAAFRFLFAVAELAAVFNTWFLLAVSAASRGRDSG